MTTIFPKLFSSAPKESITFPSIDLSTGIRDFLDVRPETPTSGAVTSTQAQSLSEQVPSLLRQAIGERPGSPLFDARNIINQPPATAEPTPSIGSATETRFDAIRLLPVVGIQRFTELQNGATPVEVEDMTRRAASGDLDATSILLGQAKVNEVGVTSLADVSRQLNDSLVPVAQPSGAVGFDDDIESISFIGDRAPTQTDDPSLPTFLASPRSDRLDETFSLANFSRLSGAAQIRALLPDEALYIHWYLNYWEAFDPDGDHSLDRARQLIDQGTDNPDPLEVPDDFPTDDTDDGTDDLPTDDIDDGIGDEEDLPTDPLQDLIDAFSEFPETDISPGIITSINDPSLLDISNEEQGVLDIIALEEGGASPTKVGIAIGKWAVEFGKNLSQFEAIKEEVQVSGFGLDVEKENIAAGGISLSQRRAEADRINELPGLQTGESLGLPEKLITATKFAARAFAGNPFISINGLARLRRGLLPLFNQFDPQFWTRTSPTIIELLKGLYRASPSGTVADFEFIQGQFAPPSLRG